MSKPGLENATEAQRNGSDAASQARQALSDDANPHAPMSKYNVHRQREGNATVTHYPNGVEISRGGPAVGMEPPPGGKIGTDEKNNTVLKDASGKIVARIDADKTVHVFTKDGEYIEKPNGKVQFKPNDSLEGDLQSKQKSGPVSRDKLETYGVSTDGKTYKFPNGVEYVPGKDTVSLSAEHPNSTIKEEKDASGHVIKTTAFDKNGKELFTRDKDGVHIPTENGVLTINRAGQTRFAKNEPAGLPKVDIVDNNSNGKQKEEPITDPFDPRCNNGDPLCGLDLGKY